MALGISGSGGGITFPAKKIYNFNKLYKTFGTEFNLRYVDYFINDKCNLNCKHCYVGFKESNNDLTIDEWIDTFDFCIKSGAKVFGVVGKEPLLTWEKTKKIFAYFKEKKKNDNTIKFGMVTNGLLLDDSKMEELVDMNIDYIDISLEGDEQINDSIRGVGTFRKVISNIRKLKNYSLNENTFISFTLNSINKNAIPALIDEVYLLGITHFLISPYLSIKKNDNMTLPPKEYGDLIQNIINGNIIDYSKYTGLEVHIRNDFRSLKYQNELLSRNIIDTRKLFIDMNDAVFQTYKSGDNEIIVNLQNWNPDYWYGFRISHDGYVSNCFDMFYKNYHERAIGNIRESNISEILSRTNELVSVG
jgi:MoaA/NifB/PqqE/SkfB family radical SAM enzyme